MGYTGRRHPAPRILGENQKTTKSPIKIIAPGLYKFGKTGRIALHPWQEKPWSVIWLDWMSFILRSTQ